MLIPLAFRIASGDFVDAAQQPAVRGGGKRVQRSRRRFAVILTLEVHETYAGEQANKVNGEIFYEIVRMIAGNVNLCINRSLNGGGYVREHNNQPDLRICL
jgi:hypothetical protein